VIEKFWKHKIEEAIEHINNMLCAGESKMIDVAYYYTEETGALRDIPKNLQYNATKS